MNAKAREILFVLIRVNSRLKKTADQVNFNLFT
jgi:hypothetical protein